MGKKQKARCRYSVWCLEMGKCRRQSGFLLFGSRFLCLLSLTTPLHPLFFWCGWSHFCWGYMSHLFPLGVTLMEPSSHCVHPKFPFQDASYSKPYLVKNKTSKKWDLMLQKSNDLEAEGGRGVEWSEQMWKKLFHASLSSSRYQLNVADWTRKLLRKCWISFVL